MHVPKKTAVVFVTLVSLCRPSASTGKKATVKEEIAPVEAVELWHDPGNVADRNLYYGAGGQRHEPHGAMTFLKEDLDGSSPKFVVRDRAGVKWKAKLGQEAQPETVAARITWAVGYYTNEDYFVRDLRVVGLPPRLHRGQEYVGPHGIVHNVRLKRYEKGEKKVGDWQWRSNPFTGTRELNGLRVVMALLNNWDLKDSNNSVYQKHDEELYTVSDLGASFGSAGRSFPRSKAKGNLEAYGRSRFITKVTPDWVYFAAPGRPGFEYLVNPKEFISRIHLEWIGHKVPRPDAEWMAAWLARLRPRQIRDAFRAAGYSPEEVAAFSRIVESRIGMLTDL